MVKLLTCDLNYDAKTATISLFADAKTDITDDMTVDGIPEGYSIDFGSSAMTANGEVAFRKSDGKWNWVGDES